MPTYFLRMPNYASDDFVTTHVTAPNETEARRIANETVPPYFWDMADCVDIKLPSNMSISSHKRGENEQ